MLRRGGFDAVEDEEGRDSHRLLGPQAAVVVDGGNTIGFRDEIGGAFFCDPSDKGEESLFGSEGAMISSSRKFQNARVRSMAQNAAMEPMA